MSAYRPRRVIPSSVNTPTATEVISAKALTKDQAEQILDEFIAVSEEIATTLPGEAASVAQITEQGTGMSNSTGNNAVVSQLKRLQRDLRGLPPVLSDLETNKRTLETGPEPVNKKIKFDDDGETPLNNDTQVEESSVAKKITFEVEESAQEDDDKDQDSAAEAETSTVEEDVKEKKKEKKEKKDKKEKKEKKSKKEKKDKKEKKEKK